MADFFKVLFGNSPTRVVIRLIIYSLILGIFLSYFGIKPFDIIAAISDFISYLWDNGFKAIWKILEYILLGAAIVVPVWLFFRFLNWKKNKYSTNNELRKAIMPFDHSLCLNDF